MTLIAAFRCTDGVVLCADSQETIDIPDRGSYRVNVNKIEPHDAGEYEAVIGGAGDGALVDGFVDQFIQLASKWRGQYQDTRILNSIRRFVRGYYKNEVSLSPAHPDDKNLGFVICLRHKRDKVISLWRIIDLHVRSIPDLTLLGWEEPLYWREAKRLYHLSSTFTEGMATPSSSEAMLLGVHLFSIAKDTSNVISGDTKTIVVRGNGAHVLNTNDVKELEDRVKLFEALSSWIFLALPDVTIAKTDLRLYLKNFQKIVLELHDHFTMHVAQTGFERLKALPDYPNIAEGPEDPYLQLPTFEDIKRDLIEDEDIIAVCKMGQAYQRQTEAEIGWEEFTEAEQHQLIEDQHKAAVALERMVKLNRALYESGQYGEVGSQSAIGKRQEIARSIHSTNEELIKLLELTRPTKDESGSVTPS